MSKIQNSLPLNYLVAADTVLSLIHRQGIDTQLVRQHCAEITATFLSLFWCVRLEEMWLVRTLLTKVLVVNFSNSKVSICAVKADYRASLGIQIGGERA